MYLLVILNILILILVTLLIIYNYRRKSSNFNKLYHKEKRTYSRYKTTLRIYYKTQLEQGISWIKDISENGARLFLHKGLKTLKIGESLGIEINLPKENQSLFIEGNIVWFKDDDAGFNFDKIIKGDIKKLIQYVTDKQEDAMKPPTPK